MEKPDGIHPLEIQLLLVFYSYSDQFGVVDIPAAKDWAFTNMGVSIPNIPFTLKQEHIDILIEYTDLVDTREILNFENLSKKIYK
jgi:hypothetical protein